MPARLAGSSNPPCNNSFSIPLCPHLLYAGMGVCVVQVSCPLHSSDMITAIPGSPLNLGRRREQKGDWIANRTQPTIFRAFSSSPPPPAAESDVSPGRNLELCSSSVNSKIFRNNNAIAARKRPPFFEEIAVRSWRAASCNLGKKKNNGR